MGGGLVMVQLRGTEGLFSMQLRGLAGSKLLWCTLVDAGEPATQTQLSYFLWLIISVGQGQGNFKDESQLGIPLSHSSLIISAKPNRYLLKFIITLS